MSLRDDFFYYSKGERIAICALLCAAACLLAARFLYPWSRLVGSEGEQVTDTLVQQRLDSAVRPRPQVSASRPRSQETVVNVQLVTFDPNLADSSALRGLGLSPFVARNVVRYRRAGGVFDEPSDLLRIYGMDSAMYAKLEPYICIGAQFAKRNRYPRPNTHRPDTAERPTRRDTVLKPQSHYPRKFAPGTRVELSEADTATLRRIPGIGSGIAAMIVYYRDKLGGFHDKRQLLEVDFVTESMLEWFTLDTTRINKIRINKATLSQLRQHPYINFYQAKVIVEYRRNEGQIHNLSQLELYDEFTEQDLARMQPYVSFE